MDVGADEFEQSLPLLQELVLGADFVGEAREAAEAAARVGRVGEGRGPAETGAGTGAGTGTRPREAPRGPRRAGGFLPLPGPPGPGPQCGPSRAEPVG